MEDVSFRELQTDYIEENVTIAWIFQDPLDLQDREAAQAHPAQPDPRALRAALGVPARPDPRDHAEDPDPREAPEDQDLQDPEARADHQDPAGHQVTVRTVR